METNKILTANILDIIFDGRNKQYGAYELRLTYNSRVSKALLLTGSLFLMICLTAVFAGMGKKNALDKIDVDEAQFAEIKKDEVIPPTPPPPLKIIPPAEVNQVRFTPPVIVKDDQVKEDEKIELITDDKTISTKTVESENIDVPVHAPVDVQGSQVIEAPETDDKTVYITVEKEAEFPGGNAAWARYVQKNLDGFNPADNGAPRGKYQVIVRFVVSKDGSISDVQAETNFGHGMEEQALQCIKNGPNWKPALQNGMNVNAYRRQPVTFIVEE